jgi:hypothetical protein
MAFPLESRSNEEDSSKSAEKEEIKTEKLRQAIEFHREDSKIWGCQKIRINILYSSTKKNVYW